jgi:hypothetical protein
VFSLRRGRRARARHDASPRARPPRRVLIAPSIGSLPLARVEGARAGPLARSSASAGMLQKPAICLRSRASTAGYSLPEALDLRPSSSTLTRSSPPLRPRRSGRHPPPRGRALQGQELEEDRCARGPSLASPHRCPARATPAALSRSADGCRGPISNELAPPEGVARRRAFASITRALPAARSLTGRATSRAGSGRATSRGRRGGGHAISQTLLASFPIARRRDHD